MDYQINIFFDENQSLYHTALLQTAAEELERQSIAQCRWSRPKTPLDALTVLMEVEKPTAGQRCLIAFDLRDQSDQFAMTALSDCDIYFKRNLFRPDNELLPLTLRRKVLPFGFNYGCADTGGKQSGLRRACHAYLKASFHQPRLLPHRIRDYYNNLRTFASLPDFKAFEESPDSPQEAQVFFQTRVWRLDEGEADVHALNEERVALIRALREAFGPQFVGGLVPTPYARQHYPDLLTELPCRRAAYAQLNRRPLIGVYTRGLFHSIAFKLPEYLAAAKCIVAEPIRNELPQPLEEGRNYLSFRSLEECVQRCGFLLSNPAAVQAMRDANFAYYRTVVAPGPHLADCLTRAFSHQQNASLSIQEVGL